jgi:arylsulfatase A-like enzyme
MKRVYLLILILGLNVLTIFKVGGYPANADVRRPNIILIVADDLGFSDLGCFGSEIQTPNLDKLAASGIRFSQFYTAGTSSASRASLLTGLYQHQAGVGDVVRNLGFPGYEGFLNDKCVTIGEVLKLNGYKTYMAGKWHLGNNQGSLPRDRGFDRYFGLIDDAGSYFQRKSYLKGMLTPLWLLDDSQYNPPESGFYMTDAITDNAIQFLSTDSAGKEPFFLYLAYTAPHWPLQAPKEDIQKYSEKYLIGWDLLRNERYRRMQKIGIIDQSCGLSSKDSSIPDWETLSSEEKVLWSSKMAVYAAMIDRMDQNIGRLIDYLKKSREYENTVIMFLSGNGSTIETTNEEKKYLGVSGELGGRDSFESLEMPWATVCNTPFRLYKNWVHEGGISSPLIFSFSGKTASGEIIRQPAHIIDIMPTIIAFSRAKYPKKFNGKNIIPMEGVSLIPALAGQPLVRVNPLCWEHEGNCAIRLGNWKMVTSYDTASKLFRPWEIYDLKADRSESNNIISRFPDLKNKLSVLFYGWADRVGVVAKETIDRR